MKLVMKKIVRKRERCRSSNAYRGMTVRRRQERTEMELAKRLCAAYAAGHADGDGITDHGAFRKLSAYVANFGPCTGGSDFRFLEQFLAVDENRNAVVLLEAVNVPADHSVR